MVFILVFIVVSFHIFSNKHGSSDLCALDTSLLYYTWHTFPYQHIQSRLNILIFIHLMNFCILCFAFKFSFNHVLFFKIDFPDHPSTKTCIDNIFASNYWHFYAVEHSDASTYLYADAQSELHEDTVLWRFVWRTSAFLH